VYLIEATNLNETDIHQLYPDLYISHIRWWSGCVCFFGTWLGCIIICAASRFRMQKTGEDWKKL